MICEFALEPELVATWHDRQAFLFFAEKFGLRTGRIVSAYPKKWALQVWKAFQNSPNSQDQNAQRNLDALLRDLTQNIVKRRSTFTEIPIWLERAETEHAERPFHAIVARENPKENGHVIAAGRLVAAGGQHPRWTVPDHPPVLRSAAELVAAVAPILRVCRNIVFIDPYFDPTKQRFMDPMAAFLLEIWANRYGTENPRVELHTGIDRFFRENERRQNRNPDKERRLCAYLVSKMQSRLPQIIPAGKKVHIKIWKQREHGQKLHNRYILSEVCGVAFGIGLDQNDEPTTAETDDLHMMNLAKFAIRWQEYLGNPPLFDQVTPSFEITGTLEVPDRTYWEKQGTKQTVAMADRLLEFINEFSPALKLKYNKFYIGLSENGQANNFATFRPQKNAMRFEVRLKKEEEMEGKLNDAGLDVMDYDNKWGRYRIRLTKGEIDKHSDVLKEILLEAYKNAGG